MREVLEDGFNGANLKVERAYRHINELKAAIDEIRHLNLEGLAPSLDANGRYTLNFQTLRDPANGIPLIIGDAVHNLRAAFDHIWMTLWRASAQSGYATFPFHETRKNLEDAVTKSPVKIAFPDVERLILEDVKPHRDFGGNELLWTITKFDKIDKHNLIIPVITVHKIQRASIKTGGITINISNSRFGRANNFLASDMPIEYQNDSGVAVDVTFPENKFLPGEPVLPSLLNMAEATDKSVELFRRTFL